MKIAFRVDASLDIGTGHIMRCLTLANALHEQGADCTFVCREFAGNMIDVIRQHNHQIQTLPLSMPMVLPAEPAVDEGQLAHVAWLGAEWRNDAQQTQDALGNALFDWLVVDHYGIDRRWEHMLRTKCHRLMVIDDITDRTHDCDVLLNQNLGRKAADYDGLVPSSCRLYVGPDYALLRPEFAALRSFSLARRKMPRLDRLLISMGGVDKDNATGMVLKALCNCLLPVTCHITVVMGSQAPWLGQVYEQAADMPWVTDVLVNVNNMAGLMADSDLAIGAAGSTSWERCVLGLPSVIVVLAENQREIGRAMDVAGVAKAMHMTNLHTDLEAFFSQPSGLASTLAQIGAAAARVTDGTGAIAIGRALLESGYA